MDPSCFRRLYREAQAEELGLDFDDFRDSLEGIERRQPQVDVIHHVKDLALAIACCRGLQKAWERFTLLYRERLFRAALLIARNESAARELVDSLYGELFVSRKNRVGDRVSKLASYTGRGPLEGWLKAILTQCYVDRYRSQRRTVSLDEQLGAIREACSVAWRDEIRVDPRLGEAIREAFLGLSAEDRYLLASYYFDQRTLAQIAMTLRVHESTVSRRLDRLLRLLGKQIKRLLSQKGMSGRQVEESMQTDVRDLSLDLHIQLLRGTKLAGK